MNNTSGASLPDPRPLTTGRGLLALSPLLVFILFYLVLSLIVGDFYKIPIVVAFLTASIYAVCITTRQPLGERVRTFSRGAGSTKMLLIVWIFILAGAFANSAKVMGSIDETVNLTLLVLPPRFILAGLFVASCFVSMATGTAIGTVIALVPLGTGLAAATGTDVILMVGAAVGGAFFGDNLSFISDTTIVATSAMGCQMRDKFRANLRIVLPAAVLILILYIFLGRGAATADVPEHVNVWKILPYMAVIVMAVCGVDVMVVLASGILLTGVVGMACGDFGFFGWLAAINDGIIGMGELIIIVLLAGGMMALVESNRGLEWLLTVMGHLIHGRRGARFAIALLTALVCLCTANNTIAIITVSGMARQISDTWHLEPRKVASILDTTSCCVQGLLPYGAHLLMAATMAGVTSIALLPGLFYPMAIGVCTLLAVFFDRFERERERER